MTIRLTNNKAVFLYLILIETSGRFERKTMTENNQPLHHITPSGKHRNWRKHRLQSIALGAAYKRLGVGFQKKSERVFNCTRRIDFAKPEEGQLGQTVCVQGVNQPVLVKTSWN